MEDSTPGSLTNSPYFRRYAIQERLLKDSPSPNTRIILTIPSYREEHLEDTLQSLAKCTPTSTHIEVLILENHPDSELPQFQLHLPDSLNKTHLSFHILRSSLPTSKAGVGLARKMLMDEAAWRLSCAGYGDGLIVGLDADCLVSETYLNALEKFYFNHPEAAGASIYYEHPLQGTHSPETYKAIAEYELHLRYYVHAQRWAGARYAFQTVGSAMVVRNDAYQAVGGMNTRKAGEDFYFLMKVMPRGFSEISDTTVIPSPRISDRVPFGTGKAVKTRLENDVIQTTYSPKSITLINLLYNSQYKLFNKSNISLSNALSSALEAIEFDKEVTRIRLLSPDLTTFENHFHRWFDGFKLMKCLHHLRTENGYHDIPVTRAASWLLEEKGIDTTETKEDPVALLYQYRRIDKLS
jgi:hypothetical protein